MTDSNLTGLCMDLIEALKRAAKGLSNPTAQQCHRDYWSKEVHRDVERSLSILSKEVSQVQPVQPIPFTERFPEQVDCDKEGNFWVGRLTSLGWRWIIDCNPTGAMSDGFTHWLPFNTQWLPAHSPVYKPEQGATIV